jgi:acylphosphatase
MNIRAHVTVSGRVQGVFFRAFTKEKAIKHGVKGWVRNLVDGGVEALLEGDEGDVERMIVELKTGPSHSLVEKASVKFEKYRGEFKDFQIKYT